MDYTSYQRIRASDGGEDYTASIMIATWFLATTYLIVFFSGQIIKLIILGRPKADDYILFAAMVSHVGHVLARNAEVVIRYLP
jgi:hypothetical protein